MRSEAIVDSRLSINVSIEHSVDVNSRFLTSSSSRAHLANQLLLYDRIVVPTKDFGIVPVLIYWMGVKNFEDTLESKAISFLHKPSLLGYVGNGNGISGYIIKPSKEKPFKWWQTALFGEIDAAIELQLQHWCPFISQKQRSRLAKRILDHNLPLQYENDTFTRAVEHESYVDIIEDDFLRVMLFELLGHPEKIDLKWLPDVEPNQIKVSRYGQIQNAIDLVLHLAEINLSILMATRLGDIDLVAPVGAERILASKLRRTGVAPSAIDNFVSLLNLVDVPDPGPAVAAGELSLERIWRLRNRGSSRRFRSWLREADSGDAMKLQKAYIRALGKRSFYESFPVRLIRFALTSSADTVAPGSSIALGAIDSFFVERWLQGFSPKPFLDDLARMQFPSREDVERVLKNIRLE